MKWTGRCITRGKVFSTRRILPNRLFFWEKYRPKAPIIAVTHDKKTSRKLSLVWGVQAVFEMPKIKNPEHLIQNVIGQVHIHGTN